MMATTNASKKLTYREIKAFVQALNALHWKSDYEEFCQILGLTKDTSYSYEKYAQFEELCDALNSFNLPSLVKLVESGAIADETR